VPGIRKTMGAGTGSAFGVCPDCDGTGWVEREAEVQTEGADTELEPPE
jgi:hypothetical protein